MQMKLAIDAMSGDLGCAPVIEACEGFAKDHKDVELFVTGKKEELEALRVFDNITIVDARDVVKMTDSPLGVRRQKESSMVKALLGWNGSAIIGFIVERSISITPS